MNKLVLEDVMLRPLEINDASNLTMLADNVKVWNHLRDVMPQPYSLQDAWDFITLCESHHPVLNFAILYQQHLAGVIGIIPQQDVYKLSGEMGYWLGEPYWNKGIATKAVQLMTTYAFDVLKLIRIYSCVFDFNIASQRVLIKAGFEQEAVFRKAFVKNGKIGDEFRFALVKEG